MELPPPKYKFYEIVLILEEEPWIGRVHGIRQLYFYSNYDYLVGNDWIPESQLRSQLECSPEQSHFFLEYINL